ncbi:unnamed protein product [Prunus armeniaca]
MEAAREKGENPTSLAIGTTCIFLRVRACGSMRLLKLKGFLFVLLLLSGDAEKDLIRSKKMNEEYEKAKQQVAESSGTPLYQVTLPIPQQLEIMTVELGVAKGKRIRGLGSSLRVESSHSGGVASSFATEQKVEELQGTVGELKGTVSVPSQHVGDSPCDDDQGNSGGSCNVCADLDDVGNSH